MIIPFNSDNDIPVSWNFPPIFFNSSAICFIILLPVPTFRLTLARSATIDKVQGQT